MKAQKLYFIKYNFAKYNFVKYNWPPPDRIDFTKFSFIKYNFAKCNLMSELVTEDAKTVSEASSANVKGR